MPVLLLSVFLDLVGFGIIIPLLPFFALHFDASALQVTLLLSVFSIMQMLAASRWGRLSDRLGRKPVLLVCLALSGLAYLWLAMAESLLTLFLARALSGIAAGKITVAQAYIADVTTPERRARSMGLIGAAIGVGLVIGPGIGGLLAGGDPDNPNWQLPALAASGLSALAFLLALTTIRESLSVENRNAARLLPRAPLLRWRPALPPGALGALVVLFFLVNFVFSQVEAIFPLWANAAFQWGPLEVGAAFTGVGAIIAGVQGGLIGPLANRYGERRMLLGGLAALTAGMLLAPLAGMLPVLVPSIALMAAGIALVNPSMTSLASRLAPAHAQGHVLGQANAAAALGRVLGPAWAGWLFGAVGRDAPFAIGGVLLLGGLLLAVIRLGARRG